VLHAVRHTDPLESLLHAVLALFGGHAPVGEGQLDVLVDRQVADQVERLEDEADLAVADAGPLGEREVGHLLLVQHVLAVAGRIEQAQDRQQRGLAAAGGAGDRDVLTVADLHVDPRQCVGFDLVRQENLGDSVKADQRIGSCAHGSSKSSAVDFGPDGGKRQFRRILLYPSCAEVSERTTWSPG
jgi:hypothetical protein